MKARRLMVPSRLIYERAVAGVPLMSKPIPGGGTDAFVARGGRRTRLCHGALWVTLGHSEKRSFSQVRFAIGGRVAPATFRSVVADGGEALAQVASRALIGPQLIGVQEILPERARASEKMLRRLRAEA